MTTVYVLIGAPGSGKSTWARENAARLKAAVVSSDEVRREFHANGQNPLNGDRVFAEVERCAREHLRAGSSVILDATHFLPKYRTYALYLAGDFQARRVAIWFDVPLAVCLRRNAQRTDQTFGAEPVSEDIVRNIHARLQPPRQDEFDEIERIND